MKRPSVVCLIALLVNLLSSPTCDGQKRAEGTYKDGKADGIWNYWGEDEKKIREETYEDGKLIKEEKFDRE